LLFLSFVRDLFAYYKDEYLVNYTAYGAAGKIHV
jgi:hypothetical protein